jgi:hypothetical protein
MHAGGHMPSDFSPAPLPRSREWQGREDLETGSLVSCRASAEILQEGDDVPRHSLALRVPQDTSGARVPPVHIPIPTIALVRVKLLRLALALSNLARERAVEQRELARILEQAAEAPGLRRTAGERREQAALVPRAVAHEQAKEDGHVAPHNGVEVVR